MRWFRRNLIPLVFVVLAGTAIAVMFFRLENNINNDAKEDRRTALAVCEGGERFAEELTEIILRDTPPRNQPAVLVARDELIASLECDELPRP